MSTSVAPKPLAGGVRTHSLTTAMRAQTTLAGAGTHPPESRSDDPRLPPGRGSSHVSVRSRARPPSSGDSRAPAHRE
jgi:hypothetical protein